MIIDRLVSDKPVAALSASRTARGTGKSGRRPLQIMLDLHDQHVPVAAQNRKSIRIVAAKDTDW